ncbi:hypothetical protein AURDEDRAFT_178014 [Auricularia subglabra TFB-10046 SS5]|uniref:Uncharacterized protein n=1 Tax=Auricularia subglabra (strain TFB-10046 / SS5) TaxID=717982 RepID=J0WM70_AURST|nr:hypothetical protein AURDEDRAFT_178014 [Auricularia subglabra TFB-10046 SS5]
MSSNDRAPSPTPSDGDIVDEPIREPEPAAVPHATSRARAEGAAHIPVPEVLLGSFGHFGIIRFLRHVLGGAIYDWFDRRVFLPALSALHVIPGLTSLALAVCYLTVAIGGQDLPDLPALPAIGFWSAASIVIYCNFRIVTHPPPAPLELPAPATHPQRVLILVRLSFLSAFSSWKYAQLRALRAAQRVRDWWGRTVTLPVVQVLSCWRLSIPAVAFGFIVFDSYVVNNFFALPAFARFLFVIAVAFQVALNNQLVRLGLDSLVANFFPQ